MTIPFYPPKKNLSDSYADPASSSPSDQNKNRAVAVREVLDFFSDDRNKLLPSAPPDDPPPHHHHDLDVNIGLNLIAKLGCGDGAAVNAGISSVSKDKQPSTTMELVQVKEELQRLNAENHELNQRLSDVKSKYANLKMQLEAFMQQRQNQHTQSTTEHEMDQGEQVKGEEENEQGSGPNLDQSITAEGTMKNARVAVRTRSEDMISDGCQWRKYGQKLAKGNPFPRGYYRCTMAVGCPVRKQVQRCAVDKTVLVTTYEGTHNHPLPPVAMTMASTTSSAARMVLSGSVSSVDGLMVMNPNLLARGIHPASTKAILSATGPFPTITLDLTHDANNTNNNPNALHYSYQSAPTLPQPHALHNQSQFSGLQLSHQEAAGSSQAAGLHPTQQLSFDDVSAAAAAITSDPNFSAVIAAAISSIMSGAQPNNNPNNNNDSNPNTINCSTNNSFSGN